MFDSNKQNAWGRTKAICFTALGITLAIIICLRVIPYLAPIAAAKIAFHDIKTIDTVAYMHSPSSNIAQEFAKHMYHLNILTDTEDDLFYNHPPAGISRIWIPGTEPYEKYIAQYRFESRSSTDANMDAIATKYGAPELYNLQSSVTASSASLKLYTYTFFANVLFTQNEEDRCSLRAQTSASVNGLDIERNITISGEYLTHLDEKTLQQKMQLYNEIDARIYVNEIIKHYAESGNSHFTLDNPGEGTVKTTIRLDNEASEPIATYTQSLKEFIAMYRE